MALPGPSSWVPEPVVGSVGVTADVELTWLIGVGIVLLVHRRRRGEAEATARAVNNVNKLFDCILPILSQNGGGLGI